MFAAHFTVYAVNLPSFGCSHDAADSFAVSVVDVITRCADGHHRHLPRLAGRVRSFTDGFKRRFGHRIDNGLAKSERHENRIALRRLFGCGGFVGNADADLPLVSEPVNLTKIGLAFRQLTFLFRCFYYSPSVQRLACYGNQFRFGSIPHFSNHSFR